MTFNDELKSTLITYFVRFYGEQHRELITQKLNSIVPIFYDTLETRTNEMYNLETTKKIELTLKFLEHHNINIPEEIKNNMIKYNSTYYITDCEEAYNLITSIFGTYEYSINGGIRYILTSPSDNNLEIFSSVNALKKYGIDIKEEDFNTWITSEEGQKVIKEIEKEKEFLNTLDKEYKDFDSQFDDLKQALDKSSKLKNYLINKYNLEFLSSIEKYLTSHDKELLESYKRSENQYWFSLVNKLDIFKIIDDSFTSVGLIESFNSSSDQTLKDENASTFQKELIIENRIKYFKKIGIYDESIPPEEFIESSLAKQYEPDKDFIEAVTKQKSFYLDKLETEVLESTSTYKEDRSLIESLNLTESGYLDIDLYKNKVICVEPASKETENGLNLVTILFYSRGSTIQEYQDVFFIHEINHAIETEVLGRDEQGTIHYKTGFEEVTNDDNDYRPYLNFSENINQLIAMDITTLMHNDGIYLFDNPDNSKIVGGSSYEANNIFTYNFYKTWKDIILSARTNNNLEELYNTVGKENFEELNRIINEYQTIPYMELMSALVNNKTNELTIKREKLIEAANEVYKRMVEYQERTKTI